MSEDPGSFGTNPESYSGRGTSNRVPRPLCLLLLDFLYRGGFCIDMARWSRGSSYGND